MTDTNAKTFAFELVSPEEKLISAPARMVVIPGEEGDFGVLPGHSAVVASIRPGVIEIFANDNAAPQRIFVAGGFADVNESSCTVLAEEAVDVAALKKEAIEQDLRNLADDLGMATADADRARVQHRIALAKARLSAVTGQLVT